VGGDFVGTLYPEGAINGLTATSVVAFNVNKYIIFNGLGIVDNIFESGDHAEGDFVVRQTFAPLITVSRFEYFSENSAEFFGVFKAYGSFSKARVSGQIGPLDSFDEIGPVLLFLNHNQ